MRATGSRSRVTGRKSWNDGCLNVPEAPFVSRNLEHFMSLRFLAIAGGVAFLTTHLVKSMRDKQQPTTPSASAKSAEGSPSPNVASSDLPKSPTTTTAANSTAASTSPPAVASSTSNSLPSSHRAAPAAPSQAPVGVASGSSSPTTLKTERGQNNETANGQERSMSSPSGELGKVSDRNSSVRPEQPRSV